ncbi:MAG: SusC/RagA family TonB-linked outer membrane protein [Mucilaginibacter sp.]|nr:SusC/RagA family TonB-linked outer membrane protein [Mucilaginibacter sp.]
MWRRTVNAKNNNIQKIDKYLKGKLDNKAMHQIEREAQDDPFFTDALDGYEKEGSFSADNFSDLKSRLRKRVAEKQRNKLLLWRIMPVAACLLLMIGAGYWFFAHKQHRLQYANNIPPVTHKAQPEPVAPAATSKGANKITVEKPAYIVKNEPIKKAAPVVDILKKMQRVKVDSNGKIAAKGNENLIARLNAKEFTGGSVREAMKKLPRDIAEKTQVVDNYRDQVAKAAPGTITITGKILDAKTGEALSGTTIGTGGKGLIQADVNGSYKLTVSDTATLSFNEIGYSGQAVKLKPGQKNLDVNLITDGKALSETVIRGYVSRKKEPANGATYIITGKEVQDNPVGNVEQLLQGKVAGINIRNGSKSKNELMSVSGRVTDNYGKAIFGATVYSGSRGVAKTDTNGRYRAMVYKDSLILVSNLGYKTTSFKINPGKSLPDVKLEEQPNRLAEVSIRGYVKRNRDETTGSSYIITRKDKPCKENARFKRRFFKKIAIAEKYVTEHANKDTITISDSKFYRALKFITEHAPSTIKADKAGNVGYSDLKIFELNKSGWLNWYESNKCNNLK